jgi:hypothetical protein
VSKGDTRTVLRLLTADCADLTDFYSVLCSLVLILNRVPDNTNNPQKICVTRGELSLIPRSHIALAHARAFALKKGIRSFDRMPFAVWVSSKLY